MNKFLLTILSFCSLSLVAADSSAEQFRRETESKLARAAERERQEVQTIADEINAQEDEEEVRDAADYDSEDELESNKQVDLKDQVAQQQDQAQHDLKAAEDILYNLKPTGSKTFKGPGLPKHLQQLVARYAFDSSKNGSHKAQEDEQQGWRLFKTIDGLKGSVVAKVVGKFMNEYRENPSADLQGMGLLRKAPCNVAGKFMVTGESNGCLKLWNINPYECIAQLNLENPIYSIVASKTGRWIAVNFTNKDTVVIIELNQKVEPQKMLKINQTLKGVKPSAELAFTFTTRVKNQVTPEQFLSSLDLQNPVWCNGQMMFTTKDLKEHDNLFGGVASYDEELAVYFTGTKKHRFWSVPAWKEQRGRPDSVFVYGDELSHYCDATGGCYTAEYFNKTTQSQSKKPKNQLLNNAPLLKAITCLHSRPKSESAIQFDQLATAHSDGSIKLWDKSTKQCKETFASGQKDINGLQAFYSPSQNIAYILSSADDGTIKIWENPLQHLFKTCAHCHKDKHANKGIELMMCICKQIKYCSKACQVADWKNHKATCSANPKNQKKEIRTIDQLD